MIEKLKMTSLRNSEFLRYHKDLRAIVMQNNPETLMVEQQLTAYSGKITEMEELYKTAAAHPITAEIEELDHQRDEIFNGIINLLAGNASHFMSDMKEAALLLQKDLEKYNYNITKGNYGSETTDLENIIDDWRNKPELNDATATLGITDWIDELERINNLFSSKYLDRNSSYASETDENTKGKRAEITITHDLLCKFLNSYSVINDTPEYRKTISEINALTEQFASLLKQRRSHAKKNSSEKDKTV